MNIKKIEADINTAKNNSYSSHNSEINNYINGISAYHVQQAIEKSLKFIYK